MENTKDNTQVRRDMLIIKYKDNIPIEEQNEQIRKVIEQYYKSKNMTMTEIKIENEQESGK